MGLEETCLHRLIGDCLGCKNDLDISHHPNNYDCKNYLPIKIMIHEYTTKDNKNDLDRKI